MKREHPALLLALSLLLGCGTPPVGDDDDTVNDDDTVDDDDAADDDDATPDPEADCPNPEVEAGTSTVPCNAEDGGDVWQFVAIAGQQVVVTVDTVGPESTFDPRLRIVDFMETFLESGDDDCICSYDPPGDDCFPNESCCPFGVYESKFNENMRVHVASFLEDNCVAGDVGAYAIRVTADGEEVVPALIIDDGPTVFGGD